MTTTGTIGARRGNAVLLPVSIFLLSCIPAWNAPNRSVAFGGLVSLPAAQTGPNLLEDPGFERNHSQRNQPSAWAPQPATAFKVDGSVTHTGAASLRLSAADRAPYVPSVVQKLQLKPGVYDFSGWVKMDAIAATSQPGSGVRICVFAPPTGPYLTATCTPVLKGTADWQRVEAANIVIPRETPAQLVVDAYAKPDGTAWFDDLALTRSQIPLQVYMLYPNYRGLLFEDQSPVARFHIAIDAPGKSSAGEFVLNGKVTDEATGDVVAESTFPPGAALSAAFDMTRFPPGHSYVVQFQISKADGAERYTYPAYRIVKVPASMRRSLTVSFDEQNRFLLRGRPSFLLGVFDSGLDFTTGESAWVNQFTTLRRLFELPINFYLNYWFGNSPNADMAAMMNVLQRHGVYNLTNANCVESVTMEQQNGGAWWFLNSSDAVIRQRAQHPGFAGFYAADECAPHLVSNVFGHYQRMKALDPGGIVFSALLPNANVSLWRDAVDVISTDPYPMYGAEPAGGYPLHIVANGARDVRTAVMGSRPFASVIQFFQFTSQGRWPTEAELRSMSYGAIAEGANGLFYWSVGTNALAWICDGHDAAHSPSGSASWCQAKVENFTNLKNVLTEMKSLEPVLTLPDRPDLLARNTNAAIRTRVKFDGTTAYLIAYNASNLPQTMAVEMKLRMRAAAPLRDEKTPPKLREGSLEDSLAAYDARIYKIGFVEDAVRAGGR